MSEPAYNYCALPLAVYACRPDQSRGRLYEEPDSANRTPFQRDRDRIIHASAFRRLKYKTQVFVYHEGDHYRTRLTHTLEVAQITRSLARALYVNEDLAETVALAHDLGHPPFAHLGEDALKAVNDLYGGFDHNDQSLRVLTVLEDKYPRFKGLNLTWETLEGVVKHNGPYKKKVSETLAQVQGLTDLQLSGYASVEAQIAAISDDIAYNNHDVEDGLRAGFFTLADLDDVPLLGEMLYNAQKRWPDVSEEILIQEVIRDMIGAMVTDVLAESRARLHDLAPQSVESVRAAGHQVVAFSEDMFEKVEALRRFLWAHMYTHYTLNRMRKKVSRIVEDLYRSFMEEPGVFPENWQEKLAESGGMDDLVARSRIVVDYIAGMTDRYAIKEHERMFDLIWDLR
ncbi:MAG: deoxyguanosinetriphosphate triphosphohydrolase [Rhodospirillales bacterium]|nr:deoxyguanosinetriphosphate triphosphohydrolase [Rhodospirillales bacterium]MCB9973101.1 deoxyguanosinetriphosphate triphosphohydrolase [Rhodospirillales bacterium]